MRRLMCVLLLGFGMGASAFATEPTIEELLDATDDVNRGESSQSTVEMQVKKIRSYGFCLRPRMRGPPPSRWATTCGTTFPRSTEP